MAYTDRQVARGRKLVANLSKAKWDLGDLALEVVPAGANLHTLDYLTSPERTDLERFSEAIGLDFTHFMSYRRIAAAFPSNRRRDDVAWAVHRILAAQDDRIKVLHQRKAWTYDTAEAFLQQRAGVVRRQGEPAGQNGFSRPGSREEQVRMAREVLADPEVTKEVLRDPVVRRATDQANVDLNREEFSDRTRQPASRRAENIQKALEFRELIWHARSDMFKAVQQWAALGSHAPSGEQIDEIVEPLDDLIHTAQSLRDALRTGSSLDTVLAEILEGTS